MPIFSDFLRINGNKLRIWYTNKIKEKKNKKKREKEKKRGNSNTTDTTAANKIFFWLPEKEKKKAPPSERNTGSKKISGKEGSARINGRHPSCAQRPMACHLQGIPILNCTPGRCGMSGGNLETPTPAEKEGKSILKARKMTNNKKNCTYKMK